MFNARRLRVLLTGIGLVLLALIALIMYARSVDPVEVVGTLLFIPVFLGLMFWGLPGGVVLGIGAAVAYGVLRYPALDAMGAGRFVGLILGRAAGYLAFGGIGGWAVSQLRASVEKLELYDQIDDSTGMLNARALVEGIDMERSRSLRYKTVFSVVTVEIPSSAFEMLRSKRRDSLLRELGHMVSSGIRGADKAGHVVEGNRHLLTVVLPETGIEGSRSFRGTLVERVQEWMSDRGLGSHTLDSSAVTFPDQDVEPTLARLRTS